MQISSEITDNDERDRIQELFAKRYPSLGTDIYLTAVSPNRVDIQTHGPVFEINSKSLGLASQQRRLMDLEKQIKTHEQKHDNELQDIREEIDVLKKKKQENSDDIADLNVELTDVEKSMNLRDKAAKYTFFLRTDLTEEMNELRKEIARLQQENGEISINIEALKKQRESSIRAYDRTRSIQEESLLRYDINTRILDMRLNRLYREKEEIDEAIDKIINPVSHLDPSKCQEISESTGEQCKNNPVTGSETCNLHQGKNGTNGKWWKNFVSDEYTNESRTTSSVVATLMHQTKRIQSKLYDKISLTEKRKQQIRLRALKIESKRINALISRLEERAASTSNMYEKYYITRTYDENFEKKGDFMLFSRRFSNNQTSIEREMSHTPRAMVDHEEATKITKWLLYLAMALNFVFVFFTAVLGILPDLINKDTFYITTFVFYVLVNNTLNQEKDKIFEAFYFWLSSEKMDVFYEDEDGNLKSERMICYHLDMLYSTQSDFWSLFNTTEADIIRENDERLVSKVERLQNEVYHLEQENIEQERERAFLVDRNQELNEKLDRAKAIADQEARRDFDNLKTSSEKKESIQPTLQEFIKYAAIAAIAYFTMTALTNLGPLIQVEGSNAPALSSGMTLLIGFVLGYIANILVSRYSRSL